MTPPRPSIDAVGVERWIADWRRWAGKAWARLSAYPCRRASSSGEPMGAGATARGRRCPRLSVHRCPRCRIIFNECTCQGAISRAGAGSHRRSRSERIVANSPLNGSTTGTRRGRPRASPGRACAGVRGCTTVGRSRARFERATATATGPGPRPPRGCVGSAVTRGNGRHRRPFGAGGTDARRGPTSASSRGLRPPPARPGSSWP